MPAIALAKALAKGAIEFVTNLIGQAVHPFVIINRIRSAFGGMNMQEVSQVYWSGQEAWNAGVDASQMPSSQPLDLADIPINPYLFGDNPQGFQIRYSVIGEYQLPGENRTRWAQFNVNSDVPLNAQQLADIWQSRFDLLANQSPRATGGQSVDTATVVGTHIVYVERKF